MLSEECKKYISKIKKLAKEPKAKRLSGYNLFLKEKSTGLKGSANERMHKVSKMWKNLSHKNKELWKVKAEKLNKKAKKEFKEEELDDQVKELHNSIEETITNFKKNLKNLPKKNKCKSLIESENKVPMKKNVAETALLSTTIKQSPVKKVLDSMIEYENIVDCDQKRLKALQDIVIEWCVNHT